MTGQRSVDILTNRDPDECDEPCQLSRADQLLDLTKGSLFDMGLDPLEDGGQHLADDDWLSDRLEIYIKEKPRGPGYVCDIVYHSDHLPVIVYAVLISRGQGLEIAELELFRRKWRYVDHFNMYVAPGTPGSAANPGLSSLITGDVLQRIPLADIIRRTERRLAGDSWRMNGVRVFTGPKRIRCASTGDQPDPIVEVPSNVARPRGRPKLSDDLLIDVARKFIDEAHRGRSAMRRMAQMYGQRPDTVRYWVGEARRRGFLAATTPGRRGASPGPNLPAPVGDGDHPLSDAAICISVGSDVSAASG